LLPIAHANDGAGSIRIPAACCGLFGLKPSFGTVPNAYTKNTRQVLYVDGCVGRSVRDVAQFTRILALPGKIGEARQGPLKIRFSVKTPLTETHPDHSAAVERVAAVLAGLGHDVEPAPIYARGARDVILMYQHLIAGIPFVRRSKLQPVTRWLRDSGENLSSERAEQLRAALAAKIEAWFGDVDIWITPTVAVPPPRIGAWLRLSPEQQFAEATRLAVYTAGLNVTGQPAGSIPVGVSSVGLPIGVQLVGRRGDDATVLDVMRQASNEIQPLASVVTPANDQRLTMVSQQSAALFA
jgi:Asp-tRNA(Asn)/Glu-tRNA(Gln) amidotransferase A subunit family amidase